MLKLIYNVLGDITILSILDAAFLTTIQENITLLIFPYGFHIDVGGFIFEPRQEISSNVVCATSKGSDKPTHTRSLIRTLLVA